MINDVADYLRHTRKGAMFIIDGPSGSGKNAIIRKLMAEDKNLKFSVSATTRQMRDGEKNGVDYYFMSNEEYNKLLVEDAFYEHVDSDYGVKYGTLRSEVDQFLMVGKDVLFDMDFPGVIQMKGKAPNDVVTIGLLPPSIETLKQRLIARGDDIETISKRMTKLLTRISYINSYDYIVVNDKLDEAVAKVQRIISGERMKRVRQLGMPDFMKQLSNEAKEYAVIDK